MEYLAEMVSREKTENLDFQERWVFQVLQALQEPKANREKLALLENL